VTRPNLGVGDLPDPGLRLSNAQNVVRIQGHRNSLAKIKLRRGCVDCGYNDLAEALEFDHRPEEIKLFNISEAGGRSWTRIWAEIQKCDIVCSNCHRKRTHDRRNALKERAGL
jgi:hypothetical protein